MTILALHPLNTYLYAVFLLLSPTPKPTTQYAHQIEQYMADRSNYFAPTPPPANQPQPRQSITQQPTNQPTKTTSAAPTNMTNLAEP